MSGIQIALIAIAAGLILVAILSVRHAQKITTLQERVDALEKK